uniref:27 kDa salivary protein n=1 Tax=Phlebotomus ariasi TaxID=59272 RepID=Q2TJC4_9DIPT|nr:27 kDa salivary protein [Phlebotomus ariasi]
MIVKSFLGVFLVILLVSVTEQDRGVDGHRRTQDDHDYSELAEYDDEDPHQEVIDGDEEEHELSGGRRLSHEDEDDDDRHYGHRGEDRENSRGRNGGSRNRGSEEQSYDPYSHERAPTYSESSEYDHSGDYDNSNYQQHSSTPSSYSNIDHYLHLIQLHSVPSDLAQYADSYLQHSKNSIRYYASHAKDFEKIRPCLESVVKYSNLLNDDLAKEYIRCQRKCYLERLNSYTSAISQYTVTTNACINNRLH